MINKAISIYLIPFDSIDWPICFLTDGETGIGFKPKESCWFGLKILVITKCGTSKKQVSRYQKSVWQCQISRLRPRPHASINNCSLHAKKLFFFFEGLYPYKLTSVVSPEKIQEGPRALGPMPRNPETWHCCYST